MLRNLLLLAVLLFSSCGLALGQLVLPSLDLQQFPGSTTWWMTPRQGHAIDESTFFAEPGIADVLGSYDQMAMIKLRAGEGGMTHRHYQQFHGGALVEGAVLITHEIGGALQSANGVLAYIPFNDEPAITEDEAVMAVQTRLGAVPPVSWEGEDFEVPTVSLIYAPTIWETQGGPLEYRLCYRVSMLIVEPFSSTIAHVDARTGEIFRMESALQSCSQGSALTLYNGWQEINTKWYNFLTNHYELRDDCRGDLIHTRIDNHEGRADKFYKHAKCDDVKDGDNIWQAGGNQAVAASIHWAAEMFYDYLQVRLGRNGLDGNGEKIKLVYRPSLLTYQSYDIYGNVVSVGLSSPVNAFWDRVIKEAHFGKGDGVLPIMSLDIVSHELTHGFISYEQQGLLTARGETYALSESFGDIFGVASEWYNLPIRQPGRLPDYTIAEDVAFGPYRSIAEPLAFNCPRSFEGVNWDFGADPDGHINGAVQSYWFYLLSQGSWGKPTTFGIGVCGIGMDDAALIAYRNITDYMGTASTFADARQGAILAAEAIYGVNSNEALQCANAWAAVNVGPSVSTCTPLEETDFAEAAALEIDIYPNPASSSLKISLHNKSKIESCNISLWSGNGVQLATIPIRETLYPGDFLWNLDCSSLPSGTYLLRFSNNKKQICKTVSIFH